MADDELLEQVKRWGHATVARFAVNDDGPSAGDNILARQRELGMRSRLKREKEREIVPRGGEQRRRFMARPLEGKVGIAMVPLWACDPVPARNDADRPHDNPRVRVDIGVPDDLLWIERAICQLERSQPLRARIVREEFTTTGSQHAKAARVAAAYGGKLSRAQYQRELYRALDFLDAKRAA